MNNNKKQVRNGIEYRYYCIVSEFLNVIRKEKGMKG